MATKATEAPKSSIIKRAGDLKLASTTLVFGMSGEGRSRYAIETVKAQGHKKVLFLTLGAPSEDVPNDWDVVQILAWADFTTAYMEAKDAGYEAIIFDKYDSAMELIPISGDTPSQQEWGFMSAKWSSQLNRFMTIAKSLVVVVKVIDHSEKGRKIDLNDRALNNLIDKFTHKHYVYTYTNTQTGELGFFVETNWLKGKIFDNSGRKRLTYAE